MKTLIQAAAVTLCAASAAQAQQAVQWRVEDGGNGHWYQVVEQASACWESARVEAQSRGGHLATLTSVQEDAWVRNRLPDLPWYFLGGRQDPDACEPACGWYWITGETWNPLWDSSQPDGDLPWTVPQDILTTYRRGWHDGPDCGTQSDCGGDCPFGGFVQEWSADCNGDGIVDYGQCRDGTLPDYDGDNIPDCCERGEACVVGSYPAQWRAEDGGNGHWYQDDPSPPLLGFVARNAEAAAVGAHLATVTSEGEHELVLRVAFPSGLLGPNDMWPALGGFRAAGSTQWAWVTGEPFVYAPFSPDPPQYGQAEWLMMWGINSYTPLLWWTGNGNTTVGRAILEWSADCNNDGIVDYGQILQGQLADANADGVPDICQQPTCVDADFFRDFTVNGADLGILLSQWGPNTPLTVSDLNGDGGVDGADLGVFLSFWGACP